MSAQDPDPYAARPAPASFDEFMAHIDAAQAQQGGGGLLVDADLYEELFGELPTGRGARPEFIAALARPKTASKHDDACPVCLQSLGAIETEEEYALASESFFGDETALGVRELPCAARHIVCARCAKSWLSMNNSCPLCRAVVDDKAPTPPLGDGAANVIEQQRETERMLALFHAVFGQRTAPPTAAHTQSASRDDRDSYAGMYS